MQSGLGMTTTRACLQGCGWCLRVMHALAIIVACALISLHMSLRVSHEMPDCPGMDFEDASMRSSVSSLSVKSLN